LPPEKLSLEFIRVTLSDDDVCGLAPGMLVDCAQEAEEMATSRRNFLKSGAIGLLFAGVPTALAKVAVGHPDVVGEFSAANARSSFDFSKDMFAPHLNTSFRIRTRKGAFDLRLTSITDLKATSRIPARIAGRESFSLLFTAARKTGSLAEGTHILEHAALGRFSLFLVPVGEPTNRHHEAIIVRL
jgi:hypothetical protein